MSNTWVVVADAARARIFDRHNGELRECHDLTHPESQLHDGDLRTGGKGEVNKSAGISRRQTEPAETAGQRHAERFAKELADFLRQARVKGDFSKLVLIAEPKILGRMRDNLDGATAKAVVRTIDKNLTRHDTDQIREAVTGAR